MQRQRHYSNSPPLQALTAISPPPPSSSSPQTPWPSSLPPLPTPLIIFIFSQHLGERKGRIEEGKRRERETKGRTTTEAQWGRKNDDAKGEAEGGEEGGGLTMGEGL